MVKKFLTALAVILAVCIPICIYAGEDPVYGDVNGDGAVNSKDLTRLMKYVAGENVEIYGGDINGDGTVNAKRSDKTYEVYFRRYYKTGFAGA